MITLGVDPGYPGPWRCWPGRWEMLEDLPTITRGRGRVKREVDAAALARLLRPHALYIEVAIVEAVTAMPKLGSASTFSLGHSLGVVVGVLSAGHGQQQPSPLAVAA